jgi:uncharacterized protein YecE (DUF72 family)
VNSTFYGQPREAVSRAWAARTPARFEFSVKLYQKFTHPRMFKERLAGQLPGEAAPEPALLDALARPNDADIDAFRRGIDPLASSGRLGALLAQFPASFKDSPASRDYLAGLLRAFAEYPIAVELRHQTWSDQIADTLTLLNAFGAAWVQIDEPKFRFSIRQNYLPNVKGFYYMRLHGRNAEQWWRHDKAEDRYNYLYSAAELKEFTGTADAARQLVKKLYLYTNNHFSAKSVANAAMIKQQLGEPIEGEYSPEFLARYPEVTPSGTSSGSDRRAPAVPARRLPL